MNKGSDWRPPICKVKRNIEKLEFWSQIQCQRWYLCSMIGTTCKDPTSNMCRLIPPNRRDLGETKISELTYATCHFDFNYVIPVCLVIGKKNYTYQFRCP